MKIISTDPSLGHAELGSVESSTKDEVTAAVANARAAQKEWAALSVAERCEKFRSFIDVARARAEEIAECIVSEVGRTVAGARGNVDWGFNYMTSYVETAERYLAPQDVYIAPGEIHRVFREPWGVVACIAPWNFPFLNIGFQCSQALLAGNAIVYKNSEYDPLFAELLRELIAESDLPNDVFQILQGAGEVGQWITDADIDMLTFTGSSKTGQALAQVAASKFIPYAAELGGSAASIVFPDADLESLVPVMFDARFDYCGQLCDALKRLIVHESIFDDVVDRLAKIAKDTKVGNAHDPSTVVGPMISETQRDVIEAQVRDAIDKGATVVAGARRPDGLDGSYYEPTLLTDVTKDMRVWHEETFGPVLPIVPFKTEAEAIELANDTIYGLNAWVMSNDRATLDRVGARLKVGMVYENDKPLSMMSPFGGYKASGMGRTNGRFGFEQVTQIKVIAISA